MAPSLLRQTTATARVGCLSETRRAYISADTSLAMPKVSFLIQDQSTVEFTIFCSDGGSNTIILDVSQKKSSATVDKTLNGGAKVYFNDNPNAKVRIIGRLLGSRLTNSARPRLPLGKRSEAPLLALMPRSCAPESSSDLEGGALRSNEWHG